MAKKPTYEQAQLQLQLYDLRREAKLRQAREWFLENYVVSSLDEGNRLTPTGSEQSALARMVTTYWDQACAMLNYGLLHEDLFFDSTGEFYAVYDLLRPILAELRERYGNPHFYAHLEKAAKRYEVWLKRRAPRWFVERRKIAELSRASRAAKKSG
jgi:hypothetical protein